MVRRFVDFVEAQNKYINNIQRRNYAMNTNYDSTECTRAKVKLIDGSRSNSQEIRIPTNLAETLETGDVVMIYNGVSFNVAVIIDLNLLDLTNSIIDYIAICKMDLQGDSQSFIKQIRLNHIRDDITTLLNASNDAMYSISQLRKLWSEFNALSNNMNTEA